MQAPPPPGPFPFNHPPQSETKAGFTLGWMAEPILLMGPLVRQYSYDGLGRLVRAVSPYPTPEATTGEVWSERYYYDGVRRIQEVVLDPILNIEEGKESGDPLVEQEAEEASAGGVDESGATTELEKAQEEGGGGDGTARALIDREYIWGPGDGGGGVDELLVQFDATRHSETGAWWVLPDGGGDSVALCDLRGESGKARVVAQWTYDAYGSVLSADHLWPHALLRVGHKGLFFDRLDVGVAGFADSAPVGGQPGTGASLEEPPRLVPFAQGFYHVRNRVYVPQFGRWLQRDPNASGIAVMDSLAFHGGTQAAAALAVDMEQMYGDGMSLYAYLEGNPWERSDPTGLFFTPVDATIELAITGYGIAREASALVSNYSFDLEMDADWAMDWSAPDDEYSRGAWVDSGGRDFEDFDAFEPPGQYMAGIASTLLRAGARAGRGAISAASRLVYELHHVIPKFLGGMKNGFRVGVEKVIHRKFHRDVDDLCMSHFGKKSVWGREKWMRRLAEVDFTKLQRFRSDFYNLMRNYDATHKTHLVAMFRREFHVQRKVIGRSGLFR